MSERQISELAGNLVRFQHHLGEMPTTDRQWAIQNTEAAIALFVEAVKNRNSNESATDGIFRLTVDYRQSLEQMVAAGRYDWTNDDITAKRFPIVGEGIVELDARYFQFDSNISSENAVKEVESADMGNPWMPAKIEHLLSHGATFPEEQRKFPIIGLGSVAEVCGSRYASGLYVGGSVRRLDLRWWGVVWFPVFRFLAVRKVSASFIT